MNAARLSEYLAQLPLGQRIKVKVRPGQVLQFPAMCMHCSRPPVDKMILKKRIGRLTRLIEVPVCDTCSAELKRQSAEEERLQKLGRLAMAIAFLFVLVLSLLLLPAALIVLLRISLALILATVAAVAVYSHFQRARHQVVRPEKRAILESARIINFSWRATTFEFRNDAFARQFNNINESLLMEI